MEQCSLQLTTPEEAWISAQQCSLHLGSQRDRTGPLSGPARPFSTNIQAKKQKRILNALVLFVLTKIQTSANILKRENFIKGNR